MENENLYTFENPEYRKTYWHTSSHIMAQAVKRLWPEVQLAIGPAIDEGWYYDFVKNQPRGVVSHVLRYEFQQFFHILLKFMQK